MKIAYFSPIPFDYLKQRPQHIAELLSQNHEIYYIEPTISLLHSVVKGGRDYISKQNDITNKLHVVRVSGFFSLPRCVEVYDLFNLNVISEILQLEKIMDQCDLLWIGSPTWFDVVKRISDKPILYDKMDDFKELTTNHLLKKLIDKTEKMLIERAEVVLTSCEVFYQEIKKKNHNTFLIRNGVLIDFEKNVVPTAKTEGHRIFGYVGAISHWYDFHVLEVILKQNPDNEIVLIGVNERPIFEHPRVYYVGKIDKDKVAEAISYFDVCLYNFKQTALLDTINPVKIYEYLAMNKPVLAVESVETKQYKDKLMLYKSDEDIINHLSTKVKRPFANEWETEKFIYENSWEMRVKQIEKILNKLKIEAR